MDEVATGSVTAVWHADSGTARKWFEVIGRAYAVLVDEEVEDDFNEFSTELATQAGSDFHSDTVEAFLLYVQTYSTSPMSVIAQLAPSGELNELVRIYDAAVAAAHAATTGDQHVEHVEPVVVHVEPTVPEADEATFNAFIHQWAGQWDGTDETWRAFRERVEYYAEGGLMAPLLRLLNYAESEPSKAAALQPYGLVSVAQPEQPEEPELPELEFDPDSLMSELIDEVMLSRAVESKQLTFESIEDDELDLSAVA